ncbi:Sbal_3080 family lipoprotein [Stenotrophobium rhamnosiphilum]|uniref:Cell division protein FtsI n=1 Tax=Stenotrophobium rhamnosiphilum TaxID=2029166 RepID=A0A2T5MG86_9GAMM|nr:Sbal_3080 family lipoprotein [Stenotrophobium rhamnosiphilum]PTU31594.1 hypothetical protein CJD38_09725 [Stenotrophobium rhamnosiphilum]
MKRFALVFFAVTAGCTSVTVRPVDQSLGIKHICIKENPKVQVNDFIEVIRDGFDRHGISSQVFDSAQPQNCEYLLTYTALRSWDFSPYLSHAELRLEKDYKQVAYAEYHLKGKGGLSLTKWAGTKSKMDPVIDELLGAYKSDR